MYTAPFVVNDVRDFDIFIRPVLKKKAGGEGLKNFKKEREKRERERREKKTKREKQKKQKQKSKKGESPHFAHEREAARHARTLGGERERERVCVFITGAKTTNGLLLLLRFERLFFLSSFSLSLSLPAFPPPPMCKSAGEQLMKTY